MTQYQATPDYYRDYIEHGWLKNQAAKVHKYISRWRGKNGKWVYKYKENINKKYKIQRKNRVLAKHDKLSYGYNKGTLPYYSGFERRKQIEQARKNAKRAFIKKGTGYSGSSSRHKNLTSRGYSGSQGSGESKRIRNTATRRTVRYPWGSNIHRWIDNKGNVITNKVQYTVRGDGKEQNPDYWEDRRRRAKKK